MFDQLINTFASFYLVETYFKGLEGGYGFYRTFPISNLTPEPRLWFFTYLFFLQESHLGFFFLILFFPLKIKQK